MGRLILQFTTMGLSVHCLQYFKSCASQFLLSVLPKIPRIYVQQNVNLYNHISSRGPEDDNFGSPRIGENGKETSKLEEEEEEDYWNRSIGEYNCGYEPLGDSIGQV